MMNKADKTDVLLLDGKTSMLGDLNMNHYDIKNINNTLIRTATIPILNTITPDNPSNIRVINKSYLDSAVLLISGENKMLAD